MTLGREDLLKGKSGFRLHENTLLSSGYVGCSVSDASVLTVVLFYGDVRLKGYLSRRELEIFLEGRASKAVISKGYPKKKL